MTKLSIEPAAIEAQLVDMRNVGSQKSMRLTLHVPEEYALKAIEAFGWPTGANPVPVAVARLNTDREGVLSRHPPEKGEAPSLTGAPRAALPPRRFPLLPLPQQAAILCGDARFQAFIREEYGSNVFEDERATAWIYGECKIASRRDLNLDNAAGRKFIQIRDRFLAWKLAA